MRKIGVDLSNWNNISNIEEAKKNGLDFVIIKAGSVVTPVDGKFENIYKQCKNAKMPVGAYWYLYGKSEKEAVEEALLFLKTIKNKSFEYPLWLDFEDSSQKNIPKKTKTEMAISFMNTLENSGYYIGLYTMGSWFNNEFHYNYKYKGKTLKDFDKWVAHWTYNNKVKSPYIDNITGIWQYSNKGEFKGVGQAGNGLDMNISFKDYEKIMRKNKLNKINENIKKEYIIISKIKETNTEKYIEYLRKKLCKKYYIVETQSGNFDYSKVKGEIILGIGGNKSQHTSYLTNYISKENTVEELNKFIETKK